MKHPITKMTKALLVVLTLMITLSLTSQAQTIQIDSTFTTNGEIFPFNQVDSIYSLSITGHVTLNSDTSLVRIIMIDNNYNEYMVYEAYPLITTSLSFDISEVCDETCYLNNITPTSFIIHTIDASITLQNIICSATYVDNAYYLGYQEKLNGDSIKVQIMNNNIVSSGMRWIAGNNDITRLNYSEKKKLFGEKYNINGFEYYAGGIYDFTFGNLFLPTSSALVSDFDWRNRHSANINLEPNFPYYGGELGWMTTVDTQDCNHCWIFAPVHTTEALVNLYFNEQINLDLSEQAVASCKTPNDNCNGGTFFSSFEYIKNTGIVDEACFPYADDPAGNQNPCPAPFTNITEEIKIHNFTYKYTPSTVDEIKTNIITKGPIVMKVKSWWHYMTFNGFGEVRYLDVLYNTQGPPYDTVHVTINDPLIGQNYWIVKNSWGESWGENGFGKIYLPLSEFNQSSFIETPIYSLEVTRSVICRDYDNDGYSNWGISEQKPSSCQTSPNKNDSDDSNPRLGPFDDKYNSVPVTPIMEVSENNNFIPDNSYYTFYDPDLNSQNNQLTLTFTITNKGSAQLNLIEPSAFNDNIQLSNNIDFTLEEDIFIHQIPMETGSTTFKITFTLNGLLSEPVSTLVIVQTNECDMDNYSFTLTFADCEQTVPVDYIDYQGITNWDGSDNLKFGDVIVKAGATLNITGDYAFAQNANLYIEQGDEVQGSRLNGGIVIIDGGRLTSLCGIWPGVDVWGDKNETQFYDLDKPSQAPLYQGLIKLINGGKISFAKNAIETIKYDEFNEPDPTTSGGIVYVNGGIIENCKHGVVFYPYKNFYPTANDPQLNWSVFYKADFYNDIISTTEQIHFNGVNGIRIVGSSFENQYPISSISQVSWRGIYSINSGFTVTSFNIPYPNEETIQSSFTGFNYGIYATAEYMTPENFININSSVFEDNERGVYLSAINNPRIVQNEFLVRKESSIFDNCTIDFDMIGLYLDNFTYGFTVEENNFYSTVPYADLGGEDKECAGITVNNSGQNFNELYNNFFDNLKVGIAAGGENRAEAGEGLCIKCNDFINCLTDIYVSPEYDNGNPITGPTIGIAKFQGETGNGDPKKLAGNTFSILTDPNLFNFEKDGNCEYIKYTYHDQVQGDVQVEPDPSLNIDLSEDEFTQYDKELACPSNQGGGIDLLVEKTSLASENILVAAYSDTLATETDGGSTDQLNLDIATSIPDQTMQLRQQLLDESPYLSDTVMKSAIEKENVLPNAIIRDVLTANPQSAKSVEVLQTLDDRIDPMPGYMLAEIMQGQNVLGEKEIIEQKLAQHKTNYSKSLGKIERYYQIDTLNLAASKDSLGSLWSSQPYPGSKYKLLFHYLSLNDSSSLFNTLNNIPVDFELTLFQENVHELYEDLFGVLWQTHSDTIEIDSTHVPLLTSIANNFRTVPGVMAMNILISEGVMFYEEPVYFPDYYKSADATTENMNDYNEESILKVFPNPAGDYCIIEYDLSLFAGGAVIDFNDSYGRRMYSFNPQNIRTQKTVSLSGFSGGVYFVTLSMNGKVKESIKLIITK